MRQKGFATILGLCLILVIALTVRSISEAEANHAREVLNFELEQILQSTAESGIIEAAQYVHDNPNFLPMSDGTGKTQIKIPVKEKRTFKRGEETIYITVTVKGERGKIYRYENAANYSKAKNKPVPFDIFDENGTKSDTKDHCVGVYLVSNAETKSLMWGGKVHRCAYAYIISDTEVDAKYRGKIYFMELPTLKAEGESKLGTIVRK